MIGQRISIMTSGFGLLGLLALLALLALGGCEKLPGNVTMGKRLAENNCGVCHDLTAARENRKGPYLWEIYGRPAGSVEDFPYSADFMKRAMDDPFVWDDEHLELFITDPKNLIPGTRMARRTSQHLLAFEGIADGVNRRDMKAYLKTLR